MNATPPPAAAFPWQDLDFMAEARHSARGHRLNLALSAPRAGTTVLFLHGVLRNWRTFFPLFEAFSNLIVSERADGTPLRIRDQRDEPSRRYSAESLALIDPAVFDPILGGHWLDGFDLATLARHVRCPVWLLQADAACGGMLGDAEAEFLSSLLPAGAVHRIRFPAAGHSLHWAQPARLVEIIRAAGE